MLINIALIKKVLYLKSLSIFYHCNARAINRFNCLMTFAYHRLTPTQHFSQMCI